MVAPSPQDQDEKARMSMTGIPLLLPGCWEVSSWLHRPCTVMLCFNTGLETMEQGKHGPWLPKPRAQTNPSSLSSISLGHLTQQQKANTIVSGKKKSILIFFNPVFYKSLTGQVPHVLFNSDQANISQANSNQKVSASLKQRALWETLLQLWSLFHPHYYTVSVSHAARYSPLQWFLMAQ